MASPDPRVVTDPHGVRVEVEGVGGPHAAITIRSGAVSIRAILTARDVTFLLADQSPNVLSGLADSAARILSPNTGARHD